MPVFEYKGLDKSGKNIRGTVDAENLRSARVKLKKTGVFVVDLKNKKSANKKKGKKGGGRSVPVQDMAMMTRQFSSLLKANIPLVDSLAAISEQVENETLAESLADVKTMVNEGASLYGSLAKYPKIYSKIFISMCEAGEMSGSLDVILIRLAEFTESQNELTSKVKGAMYYPLAMFIFTGLLLGVIFTYVIPKMVTVFESSPELMLPWYTEWIIAFSQFLIDYWVMLLIVSVASFLVFRTWKNTPNGKKGWDRIILNLPVVGNISRKVAVSRFTRTLSTLLNGGVPMLSAMSIVKNVVNNEVLAEAIDDARDNISEGESIAGPLKKSGQFPPIVLHMVSIGEKTGELENMLSQVSDSYDFEVKTAVEGLTSLLSPIMIIVMGGVIGIIVFAIMVPMFEMSSLGG